MINLSELIATSDSNVLTVKQLGDLLLSKKFFYKIETTEDKDGYPWFNLIFYRSDIKKEAFKIHGDIHFGKELCNTLDNYIYEGRIVNYYYI